MARDVVLKVDGEEVRTNDFVRRVLARVVEGFVAALDDVPERPERIEILIRAGATTAEPKRARRAPAGRP